MKEKRRGRLWGGPASQTEVVHMNQSKWPVRLASGALGGNLRLGILCAAAFPVLLLLALLINHRMGR